MCVDNLEGWKVSAYDIIVYKVCRVDRKGQLRSKMSVVGRLPQEGNNSKGTDEVYQIGKRKKSSRIGYYCFVSVTAARQRRLFDEAMLKCIIPAGTKYRRQLYGDAILAKVIIPESVIVKGAKGRSL